MTSPSSAEVNVFRRTLAAGLATRYLVFAAMAVGTAMLLLPGLNSRLGTLVLVVAGGVYVLLTWQAVQIARDAQAIPERLAEGDADAAEKLLTTSLRRFTIYPAQRAAEFLHLAQLRQAQGRHHDVAAIAGAIAGGMAGLRAPSGVLLEAQFIELEALMSGGRYPEAHRALLALMGETLPTQQAARLLALRCRYEFEIGADGHLLHDVVAKVELLGVLPGRLAAESWVRLAGAEAGIRGLGVNLLERAVSLAGVGAMSERFPSLAPQLRAAADRIGIA